MKHIAFIFDTNVPIDADGWIGQLSQRCGDWTIRQYELELSTESVPMRKPDSFTSFVGQYVRQVKKEYLKQDLIIFYTLHPYKNGFFYEEMHEGNKRITIVSLANWASYSSLPIENGMLHFLNMTLAEILDPTFRHYNDPACIYDFLIGMQKVDQAMRRSEICAACLERIHQAGLGEPEKKILEYLQVILEDLSTASSRNMSVLDHWGELAASRIRITAKPEQSLHFAEILRQQEFENMHAAVQSADLDKAFHLMKDFLEGEEDRGDYLNELTLLQARWATLQKKERAGILEEHLLTTQKNKIIFDTLDLIAEIKEVD